MEAGCRSESAYIGVLLSADERWRRCRRERLLFQGVRAPFRRFARQLTRLPMRRFSFLATALSLRRRRLSVQAADVSDPHRFASFFVVSGVSSPGLGAPATVLAASDKKRFRSRGWECFFFGTPQILLDEDLRDATEDAISPRTLEAVMMCKVSK
jgi:hypothetical protein